MCDSRVICMTVERSGAEYCALQGEMVILYHV